MAARQAPAPALGPGATIGVLGAGQLGLMLALDARRMGYRVGVLDPSPLAPAVAVADFHVAARFDDAAASAALASRADVVTFELEHVALEAARAAGALAPARPSVEALAICQDRVREKTFLREHGVPTAPWLAASSAAELERAVATLGMPCLVKVPFSGYDGRGQVRVAGSADLEAAAALGFERGPLVVERLVPFASELAVLVARGVRGERRAYPVARTVHDHGILVEVSVPAPVPDAVADRAIALAESVAAALGLVGVLAVEMFVLERGEVLVNELAPRPHNSGHYTIDACATSQFAQHVRAICGLPLGDATLLAPAAMVNLLGDRRGPVRLAGIEDALAVPGTSLHHYGKAEAWPRRKLGHLTALGATAAEALERARRAARALRWESLPLHAGAPGPG
ncbi:MAG: 5-(carboxyamino)imidazole ribonucleotide synthase [Armatimonadota bacterium]|nr:5-(carboxyamino)imidazole ribonucleotide synthase [Armatimonadota bacterium]MDR7422922.1 5-(carboxyamino)imidazole ribonucleotide synthase [Armatimonadota bacterium]MDR7454696.1 5-(carboxyamino)imidazole ribonucleotide synthase [Armatimonadota bacterium]MDR7456331.1 5-(carboxyamino)imidazole ribonucleotide synthase [Armatimonadota bacterium]MDR7496729.1 5-(carboxyamino)imidazole ribonucleotide synthase [Armatimonadota bacterium]